MEKHSSKPKRLALGSISLLIFSLLLIFGSRVVVGDLGFKALFAFSWTPETLNLFTFVCCVGGYALMGLGAGLFAYVAWRSKFQVDQQKVKTQSRRIRLSSLAIVTSLLIVLSCFVSLPTISANSVATTGYYLATPYSPYDWLIGKYSSGNVFAINGSNWANMMTYPTVAPWAAYTGNQTKVEELALASVTAGTIYLKEVSHNYSLTIPANVQVIENVNGLTRVFVAASETQGSPYTVSTDSTYYFAQDGADRYINEWTSTDADALIQSVLAADRTIVVTAGSYVNVFVSVPNNCTLTINKGATGISYLVGFTANINDYEGNQYYREGKNILAPSYGDGKQVFTWNTCDPNNITSALLSFMEDQYITDVCVMTHNVTVSAMQEQAFKYMDAGYPVWWLISVWQTSLDLPTTTEGWVTKFNQWLGEAPNGRIYFDDMQWLNTTAACNAFLDAVRSVQTFNSKGESNIIVDAYAPNMDAISDLDFSNIDYDLYTNLYESYSATTATTGARTMGGYIWGFYPYFQNDPNLFNNIARQYNEIEVCGYERLTIWAGYWEDDWQYHDEITNEVTVGAFAQLYPNPTLWSFISQETAMWLGVQTSGLRGSDLQSDLLLYLPLDDASSGEANGIYATDWSGQYKNCLITGGQWTWNGQYAKALYLNGTGTPISNFAFPSSLTISTSSSLTVSMWILAVDNTTSQTLIGQTNNGGGGWLLNIYNGGLRFYPDTGAASVDITFSRAIQANEYVQVTMVWNDLTGDVTFYLINSVMSEWETINITPGQIRNDLTKTVFGQFNDAFFGFNGCYDEVRFWKAPLNSNDVYNNYLYSPFPHAVIGANPS